MTKPARTKPPTKREYTIMVIVMVGVILGVFAINAVYG